MESLRELSKREIILAFAASCVESVARALSLPYDEVYMRMKTANMFSNLIFPHYDILHTESRETLTDRLIEYMNN